MTIAFTADAEHDLEEIATYLLENSTYAAEFSMKFSSAIEHLSRWPDSGAPRTDLSANSHIRFWFFGKYQIIYVRRPDALTIIAVLHTSRNVRRELRGRSRKVNQ